MLHKANCRPLFGGQVSYDFHSHLGKYDAYYVLFDPITDVPFTNSEVLTLVQERCAQEPYLFSSIEYLLPALKKKAAQHPNSEFRITCRGSSKEEALKRLQNTCYAQLNDLASLLFRSELKALCAAGKVTLSEFYRYAQPSLMLTEPENTRKRYLGVMENWILPVIGKTRLEELAFEEQSRLCDKLNANLSKKGASTETRRLVSRSYEQLLNDSQQYYKEFRYSPASIAKQISTYTTRNQKISSAFVPCHLDEQTRNRFFKSLFALDDNSYLAYITFLVYSGLDCSDISAMLFSSLQRVDMGPNHFYKILVDHRQYKNSSRHSTRDITNEDCAFSCFRTVVFSPIATNLIDLRVAWFHSKGLSDEEIGNLSLSCEFPNVPSVNFTELKNRLTDILSQSNISGTTFPRSKKKGQIQMQTANPDYSLIKNDALYVAEHILHLPLPMLHTFFDNHPTETDENHYLDRDSDALSRTQYLYTQRFFTQNNNCLLPKTDNTNFTMGRQPHALRYVVHFKKNADLSIHSNFGVSVNWKEKLDS